MIVYELDSDTSVRPTRYRKMSSARKAAQAAANRHGRPVTILGFSAGSYTSGSPAEAVSSTRILPRGHSNPRRVRSNSTTLRNLASVKITRHRDGTVGIVARRNAPTKNRGGLKKAQRVVRRAARSGGKNPSDRTEGYVVYPDGYRFWSLGEANKEAKAESKDGASRIEGVYSEHVISRWRYGKKEQANRGRKR